MGALDRNGLIKLPCSQKNLQTQYFLLKCKIQSNYYTPFLPNRFILVDHPHPPTQYLAKLSSWYWKFSFMTRLCFSRAQW